MMAVLVIYIVLGILYESFIHPITILSGLPSAGLGALLTLMLFHTELNIYGFVGLIMLIGIVKKNAIMMIDFALDAQRNEGKSADGSHLPGLPGPLPSDHDDHHGRADGHLADRAGLWRRRGIAAPLGLAVVGGLVVSQIAHAVHHAGLLHLPRRLATLAGTRVRQDNARQGRGADAVTAGAGGDGAAVVPAISRIYNSVARMMP